MKEAKARQKPSATGNHIASTIKRRDLEPRDVLIEIKFTGVCHSDIHTARSEWGESYYPIATGHEIAGIVQEAGPEVTMHKVGDRVGVGCMVNSCRKCENCKAGDEQYCLNGMTGTYGSQDKHGDNTQGGYSTHIVVPEDFVLRIPDSLELDKAAPLLCAGITTYSPLSHWNVGKGTRVAVIGMGGLGHMAVQITKAMGAHVTVLSQTLSKENDGKKFGADAYYATANDKTFETLSGSFDLILNTVSATLPLDTFLALLRRNGSMVNLGAPPEQMELQAFSLIVNRRSFAGSLIGGIKETQDMLDFCATHGIAPQIEKISADEIDEAWDNVVNSKVRYRYVIDIATM